MREEGRTRQTGRNRRKKEPQDLNKRNDPARNTNMHRRWPSGNGDSEERWKGRRPKRSLKGRKKNREKAKPGKESTYRVRKESGKDVHN